MEIEIRTPESKIVNPRDLKAGDYFTNVMSDSSVRLCVERDNNTLGYVYVDGTIGGPGVVRGVDQMTSDLRLRLVKPVSFRFEEAV